MERAAFDEGVGQWGWETGEKDGEQMDTGGLHYIAAHWAPLLGSGPLLISIQNNLIMYLPYSFLTKALPKFEYDLLCGQPP